MPTKREVWLAADGLREKSRSVSVRSVRAALRYGGSFSDIGPHLATWKAERGYQRVIELAGLPEYLQTKVTLAASDMWEAAMQAATKHLQGEREQVRAAIAADRELRDEALALADKLEADAATLRAEVVRLKSELDEARRKSDAYLTKVLELRSKPADPDGIQKSENLRTRAFWKYAMIRTRDKLKTLPEESPGWTFDEILEWLSAELRERAIKEVQVIDRPILAKRLYERNLRENYVIRVGDFYRAAPDKKPSRARGAAVNPA